MPRRIKKALAASLCAILAITGLPQTGVSANVASTVDPYTAAMAAHLSSIKSLTPASLDELRKLGFSNPVNTALSPERKAAQALLALIASPGIAQLDHQPMVRDLLAQTFADESLAQAESIAKELHSSKDPSVRSALARLQNHYGADQGRTLGLIHLQARLDEIFDNSRPPQATAAPVVDAPSPAAAAARLSLSNPRRDALAAAAKGDYTVRVLRGTVAGKQRLVVLLGESHVKDEWNAKLGQLVISHFPVRGIEGFIGTGNFAYRLYCSVFIPITFGLARLIALGAANKGSSLQEAIAYIDHERTGRQRFLEIAKTMPAAHSAQALESLRQVPEALMEDPIAPREYPGVTFGQAKQAFEAVQAGLEPSLFMKDRRTVFPLEIGHKAGIAERFEAIAETAGLLSPVIMMPFALWLHSFPPALTFVLALPIFFFVYVQLGIFLSAVFGEKPWVAALLAVAAPRKLVDRNRTLAGNMIEIFESYLAFNTLLAIMGQAHVPGIKKILADRYGFTEVPLNDESPHDLDPTQGIK